MTLSVLTVSKQLVYLVKMEELCDQSELMKRFEEWQIKTTIYTHPEVFTVEEMMPHVGHLPGLHTKNLFLRDKKKNFWLLSAQHNQEVNLNEVAKQVGAPGGLRFADESLLYEKLGVRQGCVTALALINDKKCEVRFIIDAALFNDDNETVYFHPLINSATVGLTIQNFRTFLSKTGHEPKVVNL